MADLDEAVLQAVADATRQDRELAGACRRLANVLERRAMAHALARAALTPEVVQASRLLLNLLAPDESEGTEYDYLPDGLRYWCPDCDGTGCDCDCNP